MNAFLKIYGEAPLATSLLMLLSAAGISVDILLFAAFCNMDWGGFTKALAVATILSQVVLVGSLYDLLRRSWGKTHI